MPLWVLSVLDLGFACLAFKWFISTANSLNGFGYVHLISRWLQRWILPASGIQMCRAQVRNLSSELLTAIAPKRLMEFFLQERG